jgi:hypothetical protein
MTDVLFPMILAALATAIFGAVAVGIELHRLQRPGRHHKNWRTK